MYAVLYDYELNKYIFVGFIKKDFVIFVLASLTLLMYVSRTPPFRHEPWIKVSFLINTDLL